MPTYEYHCTACKKDFDIFHGMNEPARTVCEQCGGALERLISRSAFQFKGGGWYSDLYASNRPAEGASGAAATPDSSTGTTATTESKSSESKSTSDVAAPASKPEAKSSAT